MKKTRFGGFIVFVITRERNVYQLLDGRFVELEKKIEFKFAQI